MALEAKTEAAELFECQVVWLVTDNENKMQLMGENVQESDRNLTVYGCSSHWLNLLGQNVKVFH